MEAQVFRIIRIHACMYVCMYVCIPLDFLSRKCVTMKEKKKKKKKKKEGETEKKR